MKHNCTFINTISLDTPSLPCDPPCHGTVGQGGERGVGPKLVPDPLPYAGFELEVRAPSRDMPAYRTQFLDDQELADIYAYLLSIKPSPAARDIPLLNF